MTYELERPLLWNPVNEKFIDDDGANSKLSKPYRGTWELEI